MIDRIAEAATVAIRLASDLVYDVCGAHWAQECTVQAQDEVRALVPWMDRGNVELLVGRNIVNFYR